MDTEAPTLRSLRIARGYTQDELAARSGVSAKTIWNIEKGVYRPRLYIRKRLLIALGMDWNALDHIAIFGPKARSRHDG